MSAAKFLGVDFGSHTRIKTLGTAHAELFSVGEPPNSPPKDVRYAQKLTNKTNSPRPAFAMGEPLHVLFLAS